MEEKLISVIVPMYKVDEKYLRKSIESIIGQSYSHLEIILVDDGSPDQCGMICDSYAKKDKRIKAIHKSNGGVSSARNMGLEQSSGDYIMFVDSDDTLASDAIELLYRITSNTNADIAVCSCHHIIDGLVKSDRSEHSVVKTVDSSDAIQYLSYNISVFDELEPTAVWGKLYKRTLLNNLRFNEKMTIGEDFVFNYYACCKARMITYSNQKLYNYQVIETSIMHNKVYSPKIMKSFEELVRFLEGQKESVYINDLTVRSVNIAFTIYLKIPGTYVSECKAIERFITINRRKVFSNNKINIKLKIALAISYINFKLIRWIFKYLSC